MEFSPGLFEYYMKTASIYFSKKEIFLHAKFKAKAGYWIASEPFIRLNDDANRQQLVQAIRDVLEHSRTGVPNPDFEELSQKVAAGLGLKSSRVLDKAPVKSCHIQLKENIISFVPTVHEPRRNGHSHKPDEAVKVSVQSDDKEINEALQLALSRCV